MTKIMLVEDDKSLREIYGVRLAAEGYTIVSAGDGEEALAMAIKERPDLILSDVMMPKISGFDMLDILRATPETKDVKVVMMTALSSEDQRARGEALGANRYLVKSQVGIEDVVRTIHDVLADTPVSAAPKPSMFGTPSPTAANRQPVSDIISQPQATTPVNSVATPSATPTPAVAVDNTVISNSVQSGPQPIAPNPIANPVSTPIVSTPPAPVENTMQPQPDTTEQTVSAQPVNNHTTSPNTIPQPVQETATEPEEPLRPASIPSPAPTPEPEYVPAPGFKPTIEIPNPAFAPEDSKITVPAEPESVNIVEPLSTNPTPTVPREPAMQPTPAQTSQLPQPTAPFSTPAPASLGDRIINPINPSQTTKPDIATLMNQELNKDSTAPQQQPPV